MNKIKSFLLKVKAFSENNWKACLFVLALLICATVAVLGWHWTDTAKTPFWWTFWIVAALLAIPGFIGLIIWFSKTSEKW
jgi:hypothetical protein